MVIGKNPIADVAPCLSSQQPWPPVCEQVKLHDSHCHDAGTQDCGSRSQCNAWDMVHAQLIIQGEGMGGGGLHLCITRIA
jgi:hypothetical protein